MDKKEYMQNLVNQLNKWSYEYYTLDNPTVSDAKYDTLYSELQKLEKELNIILPDSPTQRIGDVVLDKFEKHTHKFRLYSMDKAQTFDELLEWDKKNKSFVKQNNLPKIQYVVMKKFDGLSINNTHDGNGIFKIGTTRGTGGITGEVVTSQVKTIKSIPLKISYNHVVEIHGEVLMTREAFEEYNQTAETPLKNLRNGAAGALRNLDVKETARRKLSAMFYDVGYNEGSQFTTYTEMLEFIKNIGYPTDEYYICDTIEEAIESVNKIEEIRPTLNYDIDGAIISINDIKTRELMGYTEKFPRWAIAKKYKAEEDTTTLLDVEFNTGRTGKITPRAVLEPIELMGSTISYATLNNMDDIKRKKVKINSTIVLRKSNDVIPEVMGVIDENEEGTIEIQPPTHCTACGSELIKDGVHYFCPNTLGCKPQLVKSIVHYCSKSALDIEGLSDKTIEAFFEKGIINKVVDIYKLSEHKNEAMKIDKMGLKKFNNLIDAIEKSKECKLDSFIYGLGISNIGKKSSQDLCKYFNNNLNKIMSATKGELYKVEDFGDISVENVYEYFHNQKNIDNINELLQYITFKTEEKKEIVNNDNPFFGKSVYPTGGFNLKKEVLKAKLEELGAKIEGGYRKNLDYLICGHDMSKSGKADKAKDDIAKGAKIQIVDEDFLMQYIKQ